MRLLFGIGKTTFFVANQANMEDMPVERLKTLEEEHKKIEEMNKVVQVDIKAVTSGEYMRLKLY